jgi:hypothetical protein
MTEVRLPAPVKATHIPKDGDFQDQYDQATVPGSFNFDGKFIWYGCPCGCKQVGVLRAAIGSKPADGPSWIFNGDYDQPTLSPSVNHVGHWHGWLRDGFWVQA